MADSKNILFIGAPPPPYHGQAVITQIVFETEFASIKPTFYEARFSEELSSVGGFSFKKLRVLLQVWFTMVKYVIKESNPELYYCAGSANTVPFLRDVILLVTVGKLFKKRFIHYHSGGLPEWLTEKSWRSILGKRAYGGGSTTSIACSRFVDVPEGGLGVRELPNGLSVPLPKLTCSDNEATTFLYVGGLRETKGLRVLLKAAENLKKKEAAFHLNIAGEWVSEEEKRICLEGVSKELLNGNVSFLGRLTGDDKWKVFNEASVFVFPTFYESENMPLVVIEALGSGLPVISTNWRSIPSLVMEGKTGFLVNPQDDSALAERMEWTINNSDQIESMRSEARAQYEQYYSEEAFKSNLRKILGDSIES